MPRLGSCQVRKGPFSFPCALFLTLSLAPCPFHDEVEACR
jgi:hypothetical protein